MNGIEADRLNSIAALAHGVETLIQTIDDASRTPEIVSALTLLRSIKAECEARHEI